MTPAVSNRSPAPADRWLASALAAANGAAVSEPEKIGRDANWQTRPDSPSHWPWALRDTEKSRLVQGWGEADQIETNGAMLRNIIDPLLDRGGLEQATILLLVRSPARPQDPAAGRLDAYRRPAGVTRNGRSAPAVRRAARRSAPRSGSEP